jgi:hypothetical protein
VRPPCTASVQHAQHTQVIGNGWCVGPRDRLRACVVRALRACLVRVRDGELDGGACASKGTACMRGAPMKILSRFMAAEASSAVRNSAKPKLPAEQGR